MSLADIANLSIPSVGKRDFHYFKGGIISLLYDKEGQVKFQALTLLNNLVDFSWHEIAEVVPFL